LEDANQTKRGVEASRKQALQGDQGGSTTPLGLFNNDTSTSPYFVPQSTKAHLYERALEGNAELGQRALAKLSRSGSEILLLTSQR
jgi:hypothetical protein